jgi:hypothetical protein
MGWEYASSARSEDEFGDEGELELAEGVAEVEELELEDDMMREWRVGINEEE